MTRQSDGMPSRPAMWLVERCLPRTVVGRTMVGDLVEEYRTRRRGPGRVLWLAVTAIGIAMGRVGSRLAESVRTGAGGGLRGLGIDARAGWRSLRREPIVVLLTVATLAVGIGSVTAIMSALYGSILKPLPLREPARLVVVGDRAASMTPDRIVGNISLPNVRDLAASSTTLTGLAAYRDRSVTVSGAGEAGVMRAQEIDAGFFQVLGVPMRAGRTLTAGDQRPGAEPAMVVSESFREGRFAGDELVVGQHLLVDGVSHVVVGVAGSITQLGDPRVWLPLADERLEARNRRQVYAVGRLAPDASITAAREELSAAFARLAAEHPDVGDERSVGVVGMRDWLIRAEGRRLLALLTGAVAVVLLVACVNAALLMMARLERRTPELAVRMALGATRIRLLRILAVESLMISLAAAGLAMVFASGAVRLLVAHYGASLPRAWEITVDPVVLAAALALTAACGLVVSVLPAIRLPVGRPSHDLVGSARGAVRSGRSQRILVAGQAALAMTMLAASGLLIASVWRLAQRDLGVDPRGVVLFGLNLAGRTSQAAPPEGFVDEFLERVAGLPGVEAAAVASRRPLVGGTNSDIELPDRPAAPVVATVELRDVTPGYFEALGIQVRRGRALRPDDGARELVVVNRAFERTHFPEVGAMGQRLRISGQAREFRIAGIVDDVKEFGASDEVRPTAYWVYGNGPYATTTSVTAIVRVTGGDPLATLGPIRELLRTLDPGLAVADPITLQAQSLNVAGRDRLAVRALLVLSGGLALGLTVVGIYGVVAYAVARRSREIGIRRALGASRGRVVSLMMQESLTAAAAGLGVGLAIALAGGDVVASYLYDVQPTDPATLASAAALLGVAVAVACWAPARRAARVSATEALREG